MRLLSEKTGDFQKRQKFYFSNEMHQQGSKKTAPRKELFQSVCIRQKKAAHVSFLQPEEGFLSPEAAGIAGEAP